MRLFFALLFCGIIFGAVAQERLDPEEAKRALSASNRLYFLAFSHGDAALFAGVFAKDCWIMPACGSTLCGEEAPVDFFKEVYARGVRGGRFITVDVFGNGSEFVTETGFYQWVDGNGKAVGDGTFLVLWRRVAGEWKRFRECFGSLDH